MNRDALNKIIAFEGYYDAGEELYVSCMQFNGLLKINKKDGRVQFITTFPNESRMRQIMHRNVYCVGETLIFVPSYAKEIHTYDLQSGQMDFHPIEMQGCTNVRCIDSHRVGDKIWMFYAYADNPIVVYDVKAHKIEYLDEIIRALPEEIKTRKMAAFWGGFARNENDVYGVIWRSPYILHMNLETMAVEIISLKGWADKLTGVAYDSGVLYLTELGSEEIKTLRLLEGTGKVYRPKDDMKRDETYELVYSNVIAYQGQVILVPNSGRKIYSLRHEDGMIVPFADLPEEYEDFDKERKGWRRHVGHYFIDEGIRLCPARGNMMLDINVREQTIRGYIYQLDEKGEEEYFNQIVCPYIKEQTSKGEVCESGAIDLEDFLKYITFAPNN